MVDKIGPDIRSGCLHRDLVTIFEQRIDVGGKLPTSDQYACFGCLEIIEKLDDRGAVVSLFALVQGTSNTRYMVLEASHSLMKAAFSSSQDKNSFSFAASLKRADMWVGIERDLASNW